MVPIRILEDGFIRELSTATFATRIEELCQSHRKENRALAFAFILHDFTNPQVVKILGDRAYWNALDAISGRYLSVFYIHSEDCHFGAALSQAAPWEQRSLYPIDPGGQHTAVLTVLSIYLALNRPVRLPSILFFQVDGQLISDYFLIQLSEERIEEAYQELRDFIASAVNRLQLIASENYDNSQAIFNSLKDGVLSTNLKRVFFRHVQRFPLNLLIGWLVGKV